ncbi:ATP-dependent RNA helicase HrpB [Nymphon striatum]|nr:ATP-dependent RNA helicase HrpB [Nymphon striatum]
MIQSDPELAGVGAVVFDEFHERSLNADLGLALCLEIAGALRDDLILLAMSATLDAGPVGRLMEAPLITSEGKSFDVTPEWLDQPVPKGIRYEDAVAGLVETAVRKSKGGVLVFLPGEGEIRRVETLLQNRLPGDCAVRPLFGAMDFAAQRAAIAPVKSGRKIVLATSIAETSLTIEDIRVVVDGGRARRMRFDPGSGMARLHTERVTKAEATQRAGRAGRVAPGVAYKLWTRGEEGALAAFPPAEIESADLANLALELASWGAPPTELPFLTQPPEGAYNEAVSLLQMLGALDQRGHITDHGTALARLPLHPRLGHMLLLSGRDAAILASLLADRDPIRTRAVDLTLRLQALKGARNVSGTINRGALERIRADAKRLSRLVQPSDEKLTTAEAAGFGLSGSHRATAQGGCCTVRDDRRQRRRT